MTVVRARVVLLLLASGCSQPAANSGGTAASPAPPAPPAPPVPAGAVDLQKPCTFITAAEVQAHVGFAVTAADEGWRCKFTDAKGGWIAVELMEASLRSAREICEYAPGKRTVVAGVGDSASYFGSTVCAKVGDVAIIVDGANVAEKSPQLGRSGVDNVFVQIAKTVAGRIP